MADAPSALGTGGVASRFVSSSALEEAKQRREQEWKAAYERIGEEPPKQEDDDTYDPRSLFEKLQENKVRPPSCSSPSFESEVGEGAARQMRSGCAAGRATEGL